MGQVEVERGDRDKPVGDRFEVGQMPRRLDHRAEPEPVIIVAARIGALDDPQPAVIADPLAADADALDLVGRDRREIDVDQRRRAGCRRSAAAPSTRSAQPSAAANGTVSPMPSRE